jgi:hypothetical protein
VLNEQSIFRSFSYVETTIFYLGSVMRVLQRERLIEKPLKIKTVIHICHFKYIYMASFSVLYLRSIDNHSWRASSSIAPRLDLPSPQQFNFQVSQLVKTRDSSGSSSKFYGRIRNSNRRTTRRSQCFSPRIS